MSNGLIRRFSEMIGLVERGAFERSLDEGIRECLEAIRSQPGEKGKASMHIELHIAAQGEMVQIVPKLKVKLPEGEAFTPLVLWDVDGQLSTQHPSQFSMFKEKEGNVEPLKPTTNPLAAG
jgi:hypothetical protein